MILKELLVHGKQFLRNTSIETPELDATILLAEVLGIDRSSLILKDFEYVSPEEEKRYEDLLKRRINGECVAYILGRKEFWGLEYIVSKDVLVPRPDTETIVETALSYIDLLPSCTLLDLCTGSGAIGIALKYERPEINVFASDISSSALKIAEENAKRLVNGEISFIESDLFNRINGTFNIIVSNPPYIPSNTIDDLAVEVRREPRISLDGGKDGLEIIERLITNARDHLFSEGILLIEADPRQMLIINDIFIANNYQNVRFYYDVSGQRRVISASPFNNGNYF